MLLVNSLSLDNPFLMLGEVALLGAARHSLSIQVLAPVLLKLTVLQKGPDKCPVDSGVRQSG